MARQLNQSDNEICPKSPMNPPTGHMFNKDRGDRRFKICVWCEKTAWRTDEELMKGKK